MNQLGDWTLESVPREWAGDHGFWRLVNHRTGFADCPIMYDNGRIAYDRPENVPPSVRIWVRRVIQVDAN